MGEVLDYRCGQMFPNIARQQIKMVVMGHYDRRSPHSQTLLYYGMTKSFVNPYVTIIPSIVNIGINIGVIGRIPHVMLEEPN